MRQRNIKNLQERIDLNSTHLIRDPKSVKGRWHELFGNDRPIFLEVGSGKGKFILKRAGEQKENNYIACEGQDNVCLRVLEKAEEAAGILKLSNPGPSAVYGKQVIYFIIQIFSGLIRFNKPPKEFSGSGNRL